MLADKIQPRGPAAGGEDGKALFLEVIFNHHRYFILVLDEDNFPVCGQGSQPPPLWMPRGRAPF